MAHILEDRVLESTTTTGTGALTLAGAITGFRAFSAVCAVNDTVPYFIEAVDSLGQPTGDYEWGTGTYSGANTLTRTTVLGSSNAGAAVNFAAGSKNVGIALLAEEFDAKAPLASPALTGTPTAPNATLGTRGTRVATMESFDTEFVKSKATNGYQKLPGGLILQWGQFAMNSSASAQSLTFPVAFPTACVMVQAQNNSNVFPTLVVGTSTTGCSLANASSAGSAGTAMWFAIGY